jgi:phosphonate transport system ATP-binding protein
VSTVQAAARTMTAAIDIEHLVCHAGDQAVLDLQHLRIGAGERVAVIGHNGAGKSTLLRCLSGFAAPTRVQGRVLGRALGPALHGGALRALRTEVGQVMQGVHLVQRLSAIDNVWIGALGRLRGWHSWLRWPRRSELAEAERALAAVGLLGKAEQRIDHLSGGERQKVAVARMLMQRPRLILADEPTASLDPLAAAEVGSLLRQAAGEATLITVVHNPGLLPLLSDRVIGLKHGRVAFDKPVAEVGDAELARLYRPDARSLLPLHASIVPPQCEASPP